MTRDEVKAKVDDVIINRLNISKDQIKEDSKFIEDLGADSLDTVEISMDFDTAFGITTAPEESEKVVSVGDAIDLIMKKLAEKKEPETKNQ